MNNYCDKCKNHYLLDFDESICKAISLGMSSAMCIQVKECNKFTEKMEKWFMPKAFLLIDMPSCCDECFALDDNGDYPMCRITQEQRGYTFNTRWEKWIGVQLKNFQKNKNMAMVHITEKSKVGTDVLRRL